MSQANSDDFGEGGALIVADDQEEMFAPPEEEFEAPAVSRPALQQKQGFNIYTMLLALSFFFLLIATIMFYVEAGRFN